ncbi:MAG: DUF2384 domain-containing protein [Desulfobacteraceae bacterium]|nr:MAG: DUF2384 domain-containing protein [Desulfobacteraceae bacterium]
MELSNISNILGEKETPREGSLSPLDLMEMSNRGVTKESLIRLTKHLGFSLRQMAEVLSVTDRTIQRYGRKHRFNRTVSEQILQITEVAVRGEEIFGNKERFLSWIKSPCPALGNRTPASLLGSRFGSAMVLDELGRIEHGIVS